MADDLDQGAFVKPGDETEHRDSRLRHPARDGVRGDIRTPLDDRPPRTRREARARYAASASMRAPEYGSSSEDAQSSAEGDGSEGDAVDHQRADVHARVVAKSATPAQATDDEPRTEDAHEELLALFGGGGDDGIPGDGGTPGDGGGGHGGGGKQRHPRKRRRIGPLIAGIVIFALVVVGGAGAYTFAAPKVRAIASAVAAAREPTDYTGSGHGSITITINTGDSGSDVAKTLHSAHVVKTSRAFYQLLLSQDVKFQPGSYRLKKEMSASAALKALQDDSNKVTATVVVPEGATLSTIEQTLETTAGLSKSEVAKAAADVSAYHLPSGVTSLEGWLFPATYPVDPSWTAKQYFHSMVQTMREHLADAGVSDAQAEHVIVFASLIQKEARSASDFPKVARVFQNRMDKNMPLQSDATVAYGTGHTDRVTTTDDERADASNKYNTYKHLGLPPGAISNPGDVALKAALHPAAGSWLYFVTVNLETGETVFSDDYSGQKAAVKQFQAWLRAHPSYQ